MNKKYFIVVLGLISGIVSAYVNTFELLSWLYRPIFYMAGPIFGFFIGIGLQKQLLRSLIFIAISSTAYIGATGISIWYITEFSRLIHDLSFDVVLLSALILSGIIGSILLTFGLFYLHRIFSWRILAVFAIAGGALALPFYFTYNFLDLNLLFEDLTLYIPWQVGIAFLIAHFFGEDREVIRSARKRTS